MDPQHCNKVVTGIQFGSESTTLVFTLNHSMFSSQSRLTDRRHISWVLNPLGCVPTQSLNKWEKHVWCTVCLKICIAGAVPYLLILSRLCESRTMKWSAPKVHLLPGCKTQDCRSLSRPFLLEPEPFFSPAPAPTPTPTLTLTNRTVNILFLRDPKYDYDYDYDDYDYDYDYD